MIVAFAVDLRQPARVGDIVGCVEVVRIAGHDAVAVGYLIVPAHYALSLVGSHRQGIQEAVGMRAGVVAS